MGKKILEMIIISSFPILGPTLILTLEGGNVNLKSPNRYMYGFVYAMDIISLNFSRCKIINSVSYLLYKVARIPDS